MNRVTTTMTTALVLALTAGSAAAQETRPSESIPGIGESIERHEATDADADRAVIRSFLERDDVRGAARFTGTDAGELDSRLDGLEGERLHRAADQIRALELDDVVSLKVSTIIIVLLVLIILLIAA